MAKRSSKATLPEPSLPSIRAMKGIELLRRQIESGVNPINGQAASEHEYSSWRDLSEECLIRAFGRDSERHSGFSYAGISSVSVSYFGDYNPRDELRERQELIRAKIAYLEGSIAILNLEVELENDSVQVEVPVATSKRKNDVFLVHGHDDAALHGVARFLEQLGINPIILNEQANKGRTVIEKLTDHSDVGFAVILLTPDDVGRSSKQPAGEEKLRARQNVILELGYFLGKIGRDKVCPLYVSGVEIPSDYHGVVYTLLDDAGAWKLALARELKVAGFPVDLNKAM